LTITGTIADVKAGIADDVTAAGPGDPASVRIQQVLSTQYNGGTTTDAGGNPVLMTQYTSATTLNPGNSQASSFDFGTFAGTTIAPEMSFVFDFAGLHDGTSKYMSMNEYNGSGTPFGYVTARASQGQFTENGGVLTLMDGTTLAYSAGDNIAVTLAELPSLGRFPNPSNANPYQTAAHGSVNGWIEVQHLFNRSTAQEKEATAMNDTTIRLPVDTLQPSYNNSGMAGIDGLVSFTPVHGYTYTGTTPTNTAGNLQDWSNYWDSNFGSAPRAWTVVTDASTGVETLLSPTTYSIAFP
jgi:hypothetical protein